MIGLEPRWVEYFAQIAQNVSGRSTCGRRHIGAVLVDWRTKKILGHGRNGVLLRGGRCDEGACPRGQKTHDELAPYSDYTDCMAPHAEVQAWRDAMKTYSGVTMPAREGLVMIVNAVPCEPCQAFLETRVGTVVVVDEP